MRQFVVQRICGVVVALAGAVMLPPLAMSWFADDGVTDVFLESFGICVIAGLVLWLPVRNVTQDLRLSDGFLVVSIIWFLISAFCALPFWLGPPHLSYTDAFFESASGLTTTGSTVIVGLDALPRSVLFYRMLLQFFGGMGIVILAVAILPMLRVGGSQLFRAESTGPIKDTKLTPRIAETARALWLVYVGLNVACAIAFWVGGMSFFDAVTHAMATIATGGYSTHDASFGYFNSPVLETICMVFMFLGGVNFALHYLAWHRASTTPYFADAEVKAYVGILVAVSVLIATELYAHDVFNSFSTALRHAAFHTISNMTTTGFATTGFAAWPGLSPVLLILIGSVGACAGSTSGGMKTARVVMLFRQGVRETLQLVHPRGRFVVKLGGRSVPGAVMAAVTGFATLYVFIYVMLTLILIAAGVDQVSAWGAIGACLNNMGPGLGVTAAHFADLNDAATWICSFTMILGRLEIFTLLVLFTPAFWRG